MNSEIVGLLGIVVILLGGAYFIYTGRERNSRLKVFQEVSYPLRLQAYERMILFLERIRPQSFLTRLSVAEMSRLDLQSAILREIKAELDHNVTQQLYISKETWEKITLAATTVSASLVHAVAGCRDDMSMKEVVVYLLQNEDASVSALVSDAVNAIKDEARENF